VDSMSSLWKHRDFRFLWAGETVSEFGSTISGVALGLLAVITLHATPIENSILAAASTAPFLLVGLPAGAWVDRMRRRPVLIVSDIGRLIALGSIPLAYALGILTLVQLYVVVFVAGTFTVFFDVAYQSYLPSLIGADALIEGNSKLQSTATLAQVAGPALAGRLVQSIGAAAAVLFDAVSFAVSALAVILIRTKEQDPKPRTHPNLRSEIAEGLNFLWHQPILRAVALTTSTSNFFSSIMFAEEIYFLYRVLHIHAAVIGIIFSIGGVGGILGSLSAARLARLVGSARATILGILTSLGGLVIPLSTHENGPYLMTIGIFLTGFGSVVYNVNQVSFRQRLCPPDLLGRMNASMRFLVWGVMPIGGLIGGAIAATFSVRTAMWVGAIGMNFAVIWLLTSPLGKLRDFPETPAHVQDVAK
jgi:MFS family permease